MFKNRYWIIVYIAVLITLLIRTIPLVFSDSRLWGINHLNFIPQYITILFFGLSAIALSIPLFKKSGQFGDRLANSFSSIFYESRKAIFWQAIFIGSSMILFFSLAMPTHFLGDGYSFLSLLSSDTFQFYKWSEMGSHTVVTLVQSMLGSKNGDTARLAYQIVSVASGGLSILFYFLISKIISENNYIRFIAFISIFFSGILLLFFGYIENYSLLHPMYAGFIYFSLNYYKTGRDISWATIFGLLCITVHLQAAVLLPALLFAIFSNGRGLSFYRKYKYILYSILGISALFFVYIFIRKYSTDLYFENMFLPLLKGKPIDPGYFILSLSHLLDIFNEYILLSPLLLILFALVIKEFPRLIKKTSNIFLLILTISSFLFILIIDPKIAMPRDWDLFSLSGFAITLLLVKSIPISNIENLKRFLAPIFIIALISPLPFLVTNLHTDYSEKYFKYIINLDVEKSVSSFFVLRDYYTQNNDIAKRDSLNEEYNRTHLNDLYIRQAVNALNSNDYERVRILYKMIRPDRFNPLYHSIHGSLLRFEGKHDSALIEIDKTINLQQYNSKNYSKRAQILARLVRFDESFQSLKIGYSIDIKNSDILSGLAFSYLRINKPDSALFFANCFQTYFEEKMTGYYMLALIYNELNQPVLAKKSALDYLEKAKGTFNYQNYSKQMNQLIQDLNQ